MDLSFLVITILNGIIYGSFLLLTSLGLTLVFGLGRVVNFAHGAFYALGAYFFLALVNVGMSFPLAALIVLAAMFLFGSVVEVGFVGPIRNRPEYFTLLITFGVSLTITGLLQHFWGADVHIFSPPSWLSGDLHLLGYPFPKERVIIACCSIVIGLFCIAYLYKSDVGLKIRAIVDDREMAQSFGIHAGRLLLLTFAFASAIAGIAGALGGLIYTVNLDMGNSILIDSFLVVILGGLGSLRGAIVASYLIALAEAIAGGYASEWSIGLVYTLVAVVLVWRPTGIFKEGRAA